jgi:4-hydroxythreonine-4-phosphate dehydrogenase
LSYLAVLEAVRLCARGLASGIVTAPVSKEAWHMAGAPHLDHTELLKERTGSKNVAMLLCAHAPRLSGAWAARKEYDLRAAGSLRAVLATRHVPLSRVPSLLRYEGIRDAAVITDKALREDLGIRSPHLALLALNPHGGESGLLGREEERILKPAAIRLRKEGLRLEGPLPADAAWAAHRAGRFDALIALYHDQALIPLKLAAGYAIVNWTLGLPIVRTSPGHGTAYDIAGQGKADPSGMIAAALWAAEVAARRSE